MKKTQKLKNIREELQEENENVFYFFNLKNFPNLLKKVEN